jgi:F-type H+-transporting ATPase subunit a
MGEHGSWTDLLSNLPGWAKLEHDLGVILGRKGPALAGLFNETHFTLTHVLWAIGVMLFIIIGALKFRAAVTARDGGVVPARSFGLRALFEMIMDAVFGLMVQVMGEKNARRHFALIGSLAVFILFSNVLALIPGAGVPTTTLKTNVGLGLLVFLATHYYGVKEHGVAYFKHFVGPLPLLAPLMLPIELISHLARPASLSLRLMGNMAADHKVVFTFFTLVPILVPVPFLILGLLVCVVQTLVFCLLSMVYISMATAHDH